MQLEKRDFIFGISVFALIGFLVFVSGYPGLEWGVSAGAGGAGFGGTFNATEDVAYFINFTINNTAGLEADAENFNISQVNVTVPGTFTIDTDFNSTNTIGDFNITGSTASWRNGTGARLGMLINGSNHSGWFTLNVTPATPGEYTINVTVLHGSPATTGDINSTTFQFNMTVNDTTAPDILATNFVRPTPNFNYSGTFLLNGTVTDNYKTGLGVNYVNVSVYNTTGLNASYVASNLTGNYWNVSINTSQFPDGLYNITVYTNDTFNSINSTNITNVRFDNTNPTAGFSCSPTTVNTGSTVTCTCSPSDDTAGVNTSQTSYTASPSTVNTGTYTLTCNYYDTAGNSASSTTTYTVELASSGSSSSGGGTTTAFSYSKTIPQSSQDFSQIGTIETSSFSAGGLKAKERVRISFNSEDHYVGIRTMTESSATIEITSDPVQVDLDVGEDAKVDLDGDGYYDIYVKLNGISGAVADMTMEYINEAVAEGEEGTVSTSGEVVGTETGGETSTETAETGGWTWLWVSIGVVIVAVLLWIGLKGKKKK